jgi:Flp pilus assembly protein TadD
LWIGGAEPGAPQAERAAAVSRTLGQDSFLAFWEARQWWQAAEGPSAIQATSRAVEIEPDNAILWIDRARIMSIFAPGDPAVLESFERAEELYPASVEVPLYRGRYLLEQGDLEGARADVERAMQLAPDNPEVQQLAIEVELAG